MMFDKLTPTTIVVSYPPRVRMREVWKIAADNLDEAQDDATLTAIHDREIAGIDIPVRW